MNKTTEPAALAGIEPIDYVYRGLDGLIYRTIPQDVLVVETIPRYSAATVERLVQERDELNVLKEHAFTLLERMTQDKDYAWQNTRTIDKSRMETEAKLTASQAYAQQLREMWQKVEAEYFSRLKEQDDLTATFEAEKDMYGWNFHKGLCGGLVEFHIYMTKIAKALSLPQDDTALKAWGAKLLREIADGCRDGIDRAWITSKADELMEEKGNG